jgi:hypothetical protein
MARETVQSNTLIIDLWSSHTHVLKSCAKDKAPGLSLPCADMM